MFIRLNSNFLIKYLKKLKFVFVPIIAYNLFEKMKRSGKFELVSSESNSVRKFYHFTHATCHKSHWNWIKERKKLFAFHKNFTSIYWFPWDGLKDKLNLFWHWMLRNGVFGRTTCSFRSCIGLRSACGFGNGPSCV